MTTLDHIAEWNFFPEDGHTLSDVSKMTAKDGIVRLILGQPAFTLPGFPGQVYTLDSDVYVRTKTFAPTHMITWDFVELYGTAPRDENRNQVTTMNLRIHDGTDSRYWNGGTWAVAGAGDWNTLSDVNANLSAYTGSSIAIEVELKTTDWVLTPTLRAVKLKWTGQLFSFFEEWIYRTVVAGMKSALRPPSDYTIKAPGGTSIDLDNFPLDSGWELADVIAVYDYTNDPTRRTNLLSSYDSGTKVITLTGAIAADDTAWVVFRYQPDIAVTTSQDFTDEAQVPAIWITGVRDVTRGTKRIGGRGPYAIDRTLAVPAGVVHPEAVSMIDLDFTYAVLAPTSLDLTKLNEALINWIDAHPILRSPGLDTHVKLSRTNALDWVTGVGAPKDLRLLTGTFTLREVPFIGDLSASAADGSNTAPAGAVDVFGVKQLSVDYSVLGGTGHDTVDITE